MADSTQKRGGQDRRRIDVHQDYELRDWSDKFGVTKEQLKEAVKAVGDEADRVQEYLRGDRGGSARESGGGSGDRDRSR